MGPHRDALAQPLRRRLGPIERNGRTGFPTRPEQRAGWIARPAAPTGWKTHLQRGKIRFLAADAILPAKNPEPCGHKTLDFVVAVWQTRRVYVNLPGYLPSKIPEFSRAPGPEVARA